VVSKSVTIVKGRTDDETAERIAKLAVSPEMSSQRVVAASEREQGLDQHLDIPRLMAVLKAESERLSEGKSGDVGPILANQALALQSHRDAASFLEAVLGHSEMEALGEVHGAKDS